MNLPERKTFTKLIPPFPITWYLLLVLASASALNPYFFDDRLNYFFYEVLNCSYFASIFCLIITHVRRLCTYNWIASGGMLFTCIFNTVTLSMDLPIELYNFYYKIYMVSVMVPVAMMAILALIFNTRIEKWIVKYMDNKKPQTT